MTTSRMPRHTPLGRADWSKFLHFCMWCGVADVINCAKIFGQSVRGFRSWKTLKNGVSHWNRSSLLQQCLLQTVII